MTERDLDGLVDGASEVQVRECLKTIVSLCFLEEGGVVNSDKELDSDTLQDVTIELRRFGFAPPECGSYLTDFTVEEEEG